MCELLCVSSELPARLDLHLEALSRHGTPESLNRDGWGIASYQGHDARIVKEPVPAATSEVVRFIEKSERWSTCVLYHLRHATVGAIAYENTQPFARELGGRAQVFCHNGDLSEGAARLAAGLGRFRPLGETDSELAFCLLLARLEALWLASSGPPELARRLEIVAATASELRAYGPANFLYSDGDAVFVHSHWRPTSGLGSPPMAGLHVLDDARDCQTATVSVRSSTGRLFMAASVPLSDEGWRAMEQGELLAVRGGRVLASAGSA